jgi:hypothetical protein
MSRVALFTSVASIALAVGATFYYLRRTRIPLAHGAPPPSLTQEQLIAFLEARIAGYHTLLMTISTSHDKLQRQAVLSNATIARLLEEQLDSEMEAFTQSLYREHHTNAEALAEAEARFQHDTAVGSLLQSLREAEAILQEDNDEAEQ